MVAIQGQGEIYRSESGEDQVLLDHPSFPKNPNLAREQVLVNS